MECLCRRTWAQVHPCSAESSQHPGLLQGCYHQVKWSDSFSCILQLWYLGESSFGLPSSRKKCVYWSKSCGRPASWWGARGILSVKGGWENKVSCTSGREVAGNFYCCLQLPDGRMWRRWSQTPLRGAQWTKQRQWEMGNSNPMCGEKYILMWG